MYPKRPTVKPALELESFSSQNHQNSLVNLEEGKEKKKRESLCLTPILEHQKPIVSKLALLEITSPRHFPLSK